MKEPFFEKQDELKKCFDSCDTPEAKYEKIIQLGKKLPTFEEKNKTQKNLVPGCQSQMFLTTTLKNDKVYFDTWSDALISAGLAYLLTQSYSGFSPEIILKEPPRFLEELNLLSLLSPTRSNGLKSLLLKMRQETLLVSSPINSST